jgi:ATP-dependent helicase YprA (DUF1998 family)
MLPSAAALPASHHGTRATVAYPMKALANSQIKEIEKFLDHSGLPGRAAAAGRPLHRAED